MWDFFLVASVEASYSELAVGAAADAHAVAFSVPVVPAVNGAVRHFLGGPRRNSAPRRRALHCMDNRIMGLVNNMTLQRKTNKECLVGQYPFHAIAGHLLFLFFRSIL
jgi:hypothetical protein